MDRHFIYLQCKHYKWRHEDLLRSWPAVLTVAPGLAVNVTVTPAPANVLGWSVVLQTSSEENECFIDMLTYNYLKNIGRLFNWRVEGYYGKMLFQKERIVISPEKCPAAEAGDGPVVNMSSSPLAANLNILFLSRFDVNIFNQSKLNFWKS